MSIIGMGAESFSRQKRKNIIKGPTKDMSSAALVQSAIVEHARTNSARGGAYGQESLPITPLFGVNALIF